MNNDYGYLLFGKEGEPMYTERCSIRERKWPNHGQWEARMQCDSRWRVVHVQMRRTFIVYRGQRITIKIEGV